MKIVKRIFLREEESDIYLKDKNNIKIGVVGIAPGVGTSVIATSLAKELSRNKKKRVAYAEISNDENKTFLYDSLGMDKRFAGRKFFDFHRAVTDGVHINDQINLDEKINWALRLPSMAKNVEQSLGLNSMQTCRLINHLCGDIIVCDISWDEMIDDVLLEMDYLVAVVDPMPSKLIFGYDHLCVLKRSESLGRKTIWVVNKYNEGVNKREFLEFTKLKKEIYIPYVQQEYFYNAEYNCKLAYTSMKIYDGFRQPIQDVVSKLGL